MSDPVLGALELAELRQLSNASMPNAARVLVPTLVRQPGGITRETYPDPASVPAIPCRVSRASQQTIATMRLDSLQQRPISVVAFNVDDVDEESLTPTTRLVVSGETNGMPWTAHLDVLGVEPHHAYQTQRRALCAPTENG
jgi:hypothetical protein